MNFIKRALSIGIGAMLLGGLGVGGYFALKFIITSLRGLNAQAAMLIIAAVVALLAAIIIANGMRSMGHSKKSSQLYAEKAVVYQNLINVWGGIHWHGLSADDPVVVALLEDLRPLDRLLILYGGPEVLKAHAALRKSVREAGLQSKDICSQWGTLVLEMRKDLGSGTRGLRTEDLSHSFIVEPAKMNGNAND